jgi:hypothetical protein
VRAKIDYYVAKLGELVKKFPNVAPAETKQETLLDRSSTPAPGALKLDWRYLASQRLLLKAALLDHGGDMKPRHIGVGLMI